MGVGEMHIGLIGGIGPGATDLYYRRLISAFASKNASLELTIVHADTPTLLSNLARNDAVVQTAIYTRLTNRLVSAAAECVAVTSIAGHFCIDDFKAVSALPVVDMIAEVSRAIEARGLKRIGIIGTCTVMETSRHAQTIAPRPLEHREWLCAVGLSSNSERVLRFASQAAAQARSKLSIIHAVQGGDPDLPIQLDLREEVLSVARLEARRRIAELQQMVRTDVPVRVAVGSVKQALLEAALEEDADVLMIGRRHERGAHGRMRDLTYAMVRDSPFPVLSV
jgi:nucleotide-binding universal stress UspA family protein